MCVKDDWRVYEKDLLAQNSIKQKLLGKKVENFRVRREMQDFRIIFREKKEDGFRIRTYRT